MLTQAQILPITSAVKITDLSSRDREQMFALYSAYYEGSNKAIFNKDLRNKNYVILLREQNLILGFSTLAVYQEIYQGKPVNVVYSGDTIVDKAHWGQPMLPKAWLQFMGSVLGESPDIPLYWLLIVKGHRTYRYLQLFSKEYYPRYDQKTPREMQDLMNHIATQHFGAAYEPETGIVRFSGPRSFLSKDLAIIPKKDIGRPEVQFFLSNNPHYAQGDELVCLCKLSPTNLTRVSLKWFMQGMQQAKSS